MAEHLIVLNLELAGLNADLVRRAYRTQSLRWHPDKPEGNAARFRQIRAAYEFLREPANLQQLIAAANARQAYTNSRQTAFQRLSREGLRKERLAERLRKREDEAARRRQETTEASNDLFQRYREKDRNDKPHQYPSNYVASSSDSSESDQSSDEGERLAAMHRAAKKSRTQIITRVHAQHLVINLDDSSSEGEEDHLRHRRRPNVARAP